jgi:hypothetical protein
MVKTTNNLKKNEILLKEAKTSKGRYHHGKNKN